MTKLTCLFALMLALFSLSVASAQRSKGAGAGRAGASLRTLAAMPGSLPELVGRVNSYACEQSLQGRRFTTAFLAELEPTTGCLTYVNAGNLSLPSRSRGVLHTVNQNFRYPARLPGAPGAALRHDRHGAHGHAPAGQRVWAWN
jgi:hypothetical protein